MKSNTKKEKKNYSINLIEYDNICIDDTFLHNHYKDILISKFLYINIYLSCFHVLSLSEQIIKYKYLRFYCIFDWPLNNLINLNEKVKMLLAQAKKHQINPNYTYNQYNFSIFLFSYNYIIINFFLKYKFKIDIDLKTLDIDLEYLYYNIISSDVDNLTKLYYKYYDDYNSHKNTMIKILHKFDFYYKFSQYDFNQYDLNAITFSKYNIDIEFNPEHDKEKIIKGLKFVNILNLFKEDINNIIIESQFNKIKKYFLKNLEPTIYRINNSITKKNSKKLYKFILFHTIKDIFIYKPITRLSKSEKNIATNKNTLIFKKIKKYYNYNTKSIYNNNNFKKRLSFNNNFDIINSYITNTNNKNNNKKYIKYRYNNKISNNKKYSINKNNNKKIFLSQNNDYFKSNTNIKQQDNNSNIIIDMQRNNNNNNNINNNNNNIPQNKLIYDCFNNPKQINANTFSPNINAGVNNFTDISEISDANHKSQIIRYNNNIIETKINLKPKYNNQKEISPILTSNIINNNDNTNNNNHDNSPIFFNDNGNKNVDSDGTINSINVFTNINNKNPNEINTNSNIGSNNAVIASNEKKANQSLIITTTNENINIKPDKINSEIIMNDLNKVNLNNQPNNNINSLNNQSNNLLMSQLLISINDLTKTLKPISEHNMYNKINHMDRPNSELFNKHAENENIRENERKKSVFKINYAKKFINQDNNNINTESFNITYIAKSNNNNPNQNNKITIDIPKYDIKTIIDYMFKCLDSCNVIYNKKVFPFAVYMSKSPNLDSNIEHDVSKLDSELIPILKKFNKLELYDENTNKLNKNQINIVNLLIKYKNVIITLLEEEKEFVETFINKDVDQFNRNIFNSFLVKNPCNNKITLFEDFFNKSTGWSKTELKMYNEHAESYSKDLDELLYIIGCKEFFFMHNQANKIRTSRNHYCKICKKITNDAYMKNHTGSNGHQAIKNRTIEESDLDLNNIFLESFEDNSAIFNSLKRLKCFTTTLDDMEFKNCLHNNLNANDAIISAYKKLFVKLIIIANCEYDDLMNNIINNIYSLSVKDLEELIIQIVYNIKLA